MLGGLPTIGAGPTPGFGPNVPMVPEGAGGAAVCAKHTGAAAISAATADTMDFCLSIGVSFAAVSPVDPEAQGSLHA